MLSINDLKTWKPTFRIDENAAFTKLKSLYSRYKSGELTFDFDVYLPTVGINLQRKQVWTLLQKQEFIFSILLEKTIPPVTLLEVTTISEDNSEKIVYEVIDGKQRLTTILEFMDNQFAITIDDNDYYFKDFDKNLKINFQNYFIKTNIGYASFHTNPAKDEVVTDQDKIEWFKLLNFAGTPQDKEHMEKLLNQQTTNKR